MQPSGGDLAAGPQARHGAAPATIHLDPAHVVVRGRTHRDRLRGGIDPAPAQRGNGREAVRKGRPQRIPRVEEHPTTLPATSAKMARATTSRGASSRPGTSAMKRSPVLVDQHRALAAQRLGREGHRIRPVAMAVGWNCTNSRSRRTAPARAAKARPLPTHPAGLSCARRAHRNRLSRARWPGPQVGRCPPPPTGLAAIHAGNSTILDRRVENAKAFQHRDGRCRPNRADQGIQNSRPVPSPCA